MPEHDSGLGAIITLEETLLESSLAIRDPVGLLGVKRLVHVIPLHLIGDDEVWSRIRVRLIGLAKLDVAGHGGGCGGLVSNNEAETGNGWGSERWMGGGPER